MNSKIAALKSERAEKIEEMRKFLDHIDDAKRSMTKDENVMYARMNADTDILSARIKAEESLQELEGQSFAERRTVTNPFPGHARGDRSDEGDTGGFKNIAEYFSSLARFRRDGVRDERLDRCFEMAETRLQAMGAGSLGGFAIPSQFSTDLRFVEPDQAVVRPRATVIQAGSPPDSEYSLPTLDQTGSGNLLGGVVLAHLGEGVEMVETAAHLREVTMQPKEISAYIVCTNQVLTNWESSGAIVGGLLKRAMIICEDADFLFGDGVNKSIGLVNCGASIAYNRAGAKSISYPDVYGMFAKLLQRGGSPVWCGSPTIIPQLAAMVDSGGHSVWVGGEGKLAGSVANALPNSLFGVPLLFNDRLPVLGNKGDLMLLNPWYYLIKDGSLYAASSDQVLFTSNKTIFKIVFHVDGKPWMSAPLPLEGGGAGDVISPFVILD